MGKGSKGGVSVDVVDVVGDGGIGGNDEVAVGVDGAVEKGVSSISSHSLD